MPRCPIVAPDTVRLYFSDVYDRAGLALDALINAEIATSQPDRTTALLAQRAEFTATLQAAKADGDYVVVKRELNTGEYRKMMTDQYRETEIGKGLSIDLNKMGMSRVLAYVTDWSYVDASGRRLPFSQAALESCDYDAWRDILAAVDEHHARVETEMEARKNSRGDASKSSPTSPSPTTSAGASTTSVN